jgi:hypothetical protein
VSLVQVIQGLVAVLSRLREAQCLREPPFGSRPADHRAIEVVIRCVTANRQGLVSALCAELLDARIA